MTTIRLADYLAQTLADRGIRHVFMVTGGTYCLPAHQFSHHF
jgi:hypothetical protein